MRGGWGYGYGVDRQKNVSPLAGFYNPETALGADLVDMIDPRRLDLMSNVGGFLESLTTAKLGLTFLQATAGSRPAFSANGMNGFPCVSFDGVADWMGVESIVWPVDNVRIIRTLNQKALVADGVTSRYGLCYGNTGTNMALNFRRLISSGVNRAGVTMGNGTTTQTITGTVVDFTGSHIQDFKLVGDTGTQIVDGAAPTVVGSLVNGIGTARTRLGTTTATSPTIFAHEDQGPTFVLAASTSDQKIADLKNWIKATWGTA